MPQNSILKPLYIAEDLKTLNDKINDDVAVRKLENDMKNSTKIQEKNLIANRILNSLKSLDIALKRAMRDHDEESTYLLGMRFCTLYICLKKAEQFLKDKDWHKGLSNPNTIMANSESLSKSLERRYEEKQALTVAAKIPSVRVNGLPQDDSVGDGAKLSKKENIRPADGYQRSDFKSSIDVKSLHQLLKGKDQSVLLLDVRESEQFASSQIVSSTVINIPQEKLQNSRLNAGYLGQIIEPRMQDLWKKRHTFDFVIIVDSIGKTDDIPKMIVDIKAILTEFSAEPLKYSPLILDGGFYDYMLKFPQGTTDPHKPNKIIEEIKTISIESIRYPSISIFSRTSPRASPYPKRKAFASTDTENSTYGSFYKKSVELSEFSEVVRQKIVVSPLPDIASADVPSKPDILEAEEKNERRSSYSNYVASKPSAPVANRSLKPTTAVPSALPNVTMKTSISSDDVKVMEPENKTHNESTFTITEFHPNVSAKRGSGDLTDVSKSRSFDSLKRDSLPKPPEIPGSDKPVTTPKLTRPSRPTSSNSSENLSSSAEPKITDASDFNRENLPPKPKSVIHNEISTNIFDRPPGSRPHSPGLPAGQRSTPPPGVVSPVIRNIPIEIERDVPEKSFPDVNRALKPTKPVAQARQYKFPDFTDAEWHQPFALAVVKKPGYTGLYNMGNTCYMNAVVQCLSQSRPLRDLYLKSDVMELVMKAYDLPRSTKGVVTTAFIECLLSLWSGQYDFFAPRMLKMALSEFKKVFQGNAQQDGSEALQEIMDLLHWDLNSAPLAGASSEAKKKAQTIEDMDNLPPDLLAKEIVKRHKLANDTPIDSMLSFIRETVIKCMACRHESCTFNNDQMLVIPLGADEGQVLSLNKLISTVMQADASVNRCQWNCPKCVRDRPATQQFFFRSFPKLMFVQLSRFGNPYLPSGTKDERFVTFEQTLDLASYCRLPNLTGKARYRLYGVLDHYGTLNSGHYTSSVLHADSKMWLRFDDERVTQTSPQSVVTAKAYVLFYERID